MSLANKITLSRILLAFVFMFFLFCRGLAAKYMALFVFCLASFTDYLDGYIARKQKTENDFGKLMDPIADKILVLSAFLAFVEMKIIAAWMVIVIIFRELVVTGLRLVAVSRGKVISASMAGKHKTVSQIVAIVTILVFMVIKESAAKFWSPLWELWFKRAAFYMMLLTVVLTLISGVSYLIRNKKYLFRDNEKNN